jgi:hypothetical protein
VVKRVLDGIDENDRQLVLKQVESSTASVPHEVPSMLGLFADEPDLVDEACRSAYAARAAAREDDRRAATDAPSVDVATAQPPPRRTAIERAAEKQRSREADAHALASGVKSQDELRNENSPFLEIAHEPIQWQRLASSRSESCARVAGAAPPPVHEH